MNNQEILDNAPDGATHWDGDYFYICKDNANKSSEIWSVLKFNEWAKTGDLKISDLIDMRSLSDIKRIAELEDKLQMASFLCKPKSLEAHNLEQQAKGLEDYVIKTMDNNYILHLDPECNHQAFLINLNATALRLREHVKGGAE